MKVKCLLLTAFGCQLTACISTSSIQPSYEMDLASKVIKTDELVVSEKHDLEKAEKEDKEEFHAELKFADHEQRQAVQRWIHYFTHKDRERFSRFLQRGQPYKPIIETILKKQGVPTYFYYLAMIESGFQVRATSHASAVGMWQFIKGTGKRYGLRISHYTDERRDPFRSTIAAANYLKDLHNVFQSWFLAMAAYNAGESRIMHTIMSKQSRDFWHLAKMKALPRETRNYIPKFIAAALIGTDPAKYGFEIPEAEPLPALNSVTIPSPIRLSDIASSLSLPLSTIKRFNPNILRDITDPNQRSYRVWLPKSVGAKFAKLAALKPIIQRKFMAQASQTYRIRRGDSLASIAHKFGTNIPTIKRLNGMRSNRIYAGRRLKVPSSSAAAMVTKYRVKRGDSLSGLARRFGVSVRNLKKINAIPHSRIYVGQVLKVAPNQG